MGKLACCRFSDGRAPIHGLRAVCGSSDPTNRRGMLSGAVYKKPPRRNALVAAVVE
jgi:hypothetical protein